MFWARTLPEKLDEQASKARQKRRKLGFNTAIRGEINNISTTKPREGTFWPVHYSGPPGGIRHGKERIILVLQIVLCFLDG